MYQELLYYGSNNVLKNQSSSEFLDYIIDKSIDLSNYIYFLLLRLLVIYTWYLVNQTSLCLVSIKCHFCMYVRTKHRLHVFDFKS